MTTTNSYAIHVYENGKHIGRLSTDGSVTNRVMYAGVFTREVAEKIAADINGGENLTEDAGSGLSAKVRPFNQ